MKQVNIKKLFQKNSHGFSKAWEFETELSKEENTSLGNPGRGWYQLYSFAVEQKIDPKELKWSLDAQDEIALVVVDIGAYRSQPLDEEALHNLREILKFFAHYQKDMILRIVYDREGKGMEREPGLYARVTEHMEQVGPILAEYARSILTLQGLFVGNWGEMHGSKYLSREQMQGLVQTMEEVTKGLCPLAVRRPVFWRWVSGQTAFGGEYAGNIGLFDDAMFASATHLGTFGEKAAKEAGWQLPWRTQEELLFQKWLGDFVPCGGEAVMPEDGAESEDAQNPGAVIDRLKTMHITYLNRIYDGRLLEKWRQIPCGVPGLWQEKSLYDYIGGHLGYRFVITDVKVRKKQSLQIEVIIENKGFAGIYAETEVWLVVEGQSPQESRREKIDCDPRTWKSGSQNVIVGCLPEESGRVYLELHRKWDKKTIRPGNKCEPDGKVYLGRLTWKQ